MPAGLRTLFCLLVTVALFTSFVATHAEPGSDSGDWVVTRDTVLQEENREIKGNITVEPGTRLTLEGTDLRVGGTLHLHPEAVLELTPHGDTPSRLSASPDGPGFWIHAEGTIITRGTPAAQIAGLWGDGLTSALPGHEGGLQVFGAAELEDLRIHNSTAGLFVAEGASAVLQNATIETMGEFGVATLGDLRLLDVTIASNEVNLVGKDTCDVHAKDTRFLAAELEQLLINGCRVTLHRSLLDGGGVGVVANNAADVTLENTLVKGYKIDALNSFAGPTPDLRPTVRFHNVTLDPAPDAVRAADLTGNELVEFVNVTASGHASHGIQASQAVLSVRDSVIEDNGGYGIQLTGGHFLIDPLQSGNRFGPDGAHNHQGAVSHVVFARFHAGEQTGKGFVPAEGELDVALHSADKTPLEPLSTRSLGPGSVEIRYEAYVTGPNGQTRSLAPVAYEATHPGWHGSKTGHVDPANATMFFAVEQSWLAGFWQLLVQSIPLFFFAAGGALILFGIGGHRLLRLRKKRPAPAHRKRDPAN